MAILLFPRSPTPMVLVMGSVQTRPAVIDGQIVPRRLLNLSATLDHRVVDAQHGGTLFRYLQTGNPPSGTTGILNALSGFSTRS
ncbi:MAG: 2-oxo acid dehydrogenase subunit E2 [Saprospiraceae bacterium]|nr:2-oxo acid dehydrogenase subunit E2 [Saprospiraceae bacterium]